MNIYHTNIEKDTTENNNYRKVVATGKYSQVVLMSIKPKEEIGLEIHNDIDQFFRIEQGKGIALIGQNNPIKYDLNDGVALLVPAGTWHNIINTSNEPLKLYSIYSPPNHPPNRIQKDKPLIDQDGGNKKRIHYY